MVSEGGTEEDRKKNQKREREASWGHMDGGGGGEEGQLGSQAVLFACYQACSPHLAASNGGR